MKIISQLKNYVPITYWNNKLIAINNTSLYAIKLDLSKVEFITKIPNERFNSFVVPRLLKRIFRVNNVVGRTIPNSDILILKHGISIYSINLKFGSIVKEFILHNTNILNLSYVKSEILGTGMYFGEYKKNDEMSSIKIYQRNNSGIWNEVYEFKKGEINHVHNIIQEDSRTILVLTGDYGSGPCIWRIKDSFKNVSRITNSHQKYRSCWGKIINKFIFQ